MRLERKQPDFASWPILKSERLELLGIVCNVFIEAGYIVKYDPGSFFDVSKDPADVPAD